MTSPRIPRPRLARPKLILKISASLAVLALPFWLLNWSDRVVDCEGRQALVVTAGADVVSLRYLDEPSQDGLGWVTVPRTHIDKWIPGVQSILLRSDGRFVLLGLLVVLMTTVLLGCRWSLLLSGLASPVSISEATMWYIRASAADVLGAGQLGLEAGRAAIAGRALGGYAGTVVVQAAERCLGLLALSVLVWAGIAYSSGESVAGMGSLRTIALGTVLGLILFGSILALVLCRSGASRVGARMDGPRPRSLGETALEAGIRLTGRPFLFLRALGLSLAIHLSTVVYHYWLSQALGIPAGFSVFLVAVPVVSLALALPITIAGLGVFEGSMILLLTTMSGATAGEVLALCALHRLMGIPKRLLIIGALWMPALKGQVRPTVDPDKRSAARASQREALADLR